MRHDVYLTGRDVLSVVDMATRIRETWLDVGRVIIVDNESTYPPLVGRYLSMPPGIELKLLDNRGPRAAWTVLDFCGAPYVVSDGDLDVSEIPVDVLPRWRQRLAEHRSLIKVGAALRIDDLPDTVLGHRAHEHESQFWEKPTSDGFYSANIDTTLAMYREPSWGGYGPAERDGQAVARHLLWYLNSEPPADWRHYLDRSRPGDGTHWSAMFRELTT